MEAGERIVSALFRNMKGEIKRVAVEIKVTAKWKGLQNKKELRKNEGKIETASELKK